MSERWWRKRKKRRPHSWFDVFEEFDRLEEMMDAVMDRAFEIPSREPRVHEPYVYGFSMSFGPNGKPVIREFGNVHQSRLGPKIREEREPLVDVMEEDKDVVVVAELPGVDSDDIKLHATEDHLAISVDTPRRKYRKELRLPASIDPKSARASYKNGVLEVHLKKACGKGLRGKKVFVR